ncbi:MAG: glycosyltransferase [Pirellulales bacterium]
MLYGHRVAVVLPTYNRYAYLREALLSVLSQTRPADRIVVVDDGSTDDTHLIAKEFPEVDYVCKANEGLSAARNFGAARAEDCELLVFLDDDDRLMPNSLELQVAEFARRPEIGIVYGRALLIDGQGRRIGEHLRNHKPPAAVLEHLLVDNYILIQTVMVRHSALRAVGGFRRFLGEDLDLYIRLALNKVPFSFLDYPLAEYRKLPGTMSANKLQYASAILRMIERHLPDLPQERTPLYHTAFYHYRVGRAALEQKEYEVARAELAMAIRGRPVQPHFWLYWVTARFPRVLEGVLKAGRSLKRKLADLLVALGLREKRWGTPTP